MWPLGPATFAVVFIFLYVAHGIADHWIQTHQEAMDKGNAGWPGRKACAAHVLSYTVCTMAAVALADWMFALGLAFWAIMAGQAISAVTHYWVDRRTTLAWLCERIGKGDYYRLGQPRNAVAYVEETNVKVELLEPGVDGGTTWDNRTLGTGAYTLDQWWHIGWLLVAAMVTVLL